MWIAKAWPAKPLRLVEKGVLKNFLLTRQPVRGFEGPTDGRACRAATAQMRRPSATCSSARRETVPAAELKKKLIELLQDARQALWHHRPQDGFPLLGDPRRSAPAAFGQRESGGRPVSLPILVYKVYPDGREELVRGLRFRGLQRPLAAATSWRRGDDSNVFEFMDRRGAFCPDRRAPSSRREASVVAPSVLIDDLELHPIEERIPRSRRWCRRRRWRHRNPVCA